MMGAMTADPVGADSAKATRILAVARELMLKRGVRGLTIAEIAEKAHVGKGTVYLYWKSKEDLLVGLFTRDFLAALDETRAALTATPDLARPHRLCPHLLRTALKHPFVLAMQLGDVDMLGVLAEHPLSRRLLNRLGPGALVYTVLPVWRRHQLARTDWSLADQAYALRALLAGFFELAVTDHQLLPDVAVDEPDRVIAAAVTALLGEERAGPEEVRATAVEGLRLLAEVRAGALASITPGAPAPTP